MITIIFMSIVFGALVSLIIVFSERVYKDYKTSKLFNFAPEPFISSKEEEDKLKKEMIETFVGSPGDLIFKLECFLESLKFHDQILDRMFQTDMDSEDHLAIGSTLGLLIGKIESKIKNLRQGV
ncbi:hypothetical protein [Leptospira alexanderi]|uniref:hypothetical protein n=1 Tax=Leptospira alexanderi TaxID=100053 RepID=UPI002014C9B3|nr:hypothetical protein [Leptospira alexanderi]